jgi:hypothetical protein
MSDRRPPSPIALTDDQLTEIFRLTTPLQPACRDAFLQILAHELQGRSVIGDGSLYRLARQIIRDLEAPSALVTAVRAPRRSA